MEKLPVFRTAGNAIGFTLWNSFTIFRLAWLPFTALFAAEVGVAYFLMSSLGETLDRVPNPMTMSLIFEKVLALNLVVMVLQAIVIAAVAVSIHRVILFGDRRPGQYFNFAFGKTELLYVVMGTLSVLLLLVVFAAVFAPLVFLVSSGDPVGFFEKITKDPENFVKVMGPGGATFFVFMGVYLVVWVLMIYLSLRLAVWPPAVVATNRLSWAEPWQLTRGNVWRLIGAIVLTFGWIYVLIMLAIASFAYNAYKTKMQQAPDVPAITAPAEPATVAPTPPAQTAPKNPAAEVAPSEKAPAASQAMPVPPSATEVTESEKEEDADAVRERFDQMLAPYTPMLWLLQLLAYIYFTALGVALISYSYKALKGYPAGEPIPAEVE